MANGGFLYVITTAGVGSQEKAASVQMQMGNFEPTEVGMSVFALGALVKF